MGITNREILARSDAMKLSGAGCAGWGLRVTMTRVRSRVMRMRQGRALGPTQVRSRMAIQAT